MADEKPAAAPATAPADEKPAAPAPETGAFKSAADIRAWVRREIALAHAGHSDETRAALNP